MSSNPIELGQLAATRLASLLDALPGEQTPALFGHRDAKPRGISPLRARHARRRSGESAPSRTANSTRRSRSTPSSCKRFACVAASPAGLAIPIDAIADWRRSRRGTKDRLPEFERLADEIRERRQLGRIVARRRVEQASARALSARPAVVQRARRSRRAVTADGRKPRACSFASSRSIRWRWPRATDRARRAKCCGVSRGCDSRSATAPAPKRRRADGSRFNPTCRLRGEISRRRSPRLDESTEAVDAGFHMVALSKDAPAAVDFGRTMLAARRLRHRRFTRRARGGGRPIPCWPMACSICTLMLAPRARSVHRVSAASSALPITNGLSLVRADGLARIGRLLDARGRSSSSPDIRKDRRGPGSSRRPRRAGSPGRTRSRPTRWFARATRPRRALSADSILRAGNQSYYGRDKVLHHHVLGMLFFAQGRFVGRGARAARRRWAAGVLDAHATSSSRERSRRSSTTPTRSRHCATHGSRRSTRMGRYVPLSEIDWWLARTFAAAGQGDSARVYAGYVRSAWRDADPAVKARLDSLPP